MLEERMIRVTKPDSLDGEVSIRLFFDYYRPDGILSKNGMTIDDIDNLPLAPPENYEPLCRCLRECYTKCFPVRRENCPYKLDY